MGIRGGRLLFLPFTLLLLFLAVAPSPGADFTVTVLERGGGLPVEGAVVVLGETDIYGTADEKGIVLFTAADLPESLKVLAVGYETLIHTVRRERVLYKVYLEPILVEGEGLEVTAERIEEKVSKISLTKEEVIEAPGSMGDPLKSITSLPGIVSAYDGSGIVYMRGSDADENIVWVNRTPVGYLYHWGGFQSTINPSLVEDFNIFPAGFPVEYGDSLGGVIDVRLRTPRTDSFRLNLDISTINGSFLVEGPLGSRGGRTGFFLAGRRSYIDLLFSPSDFDSLFGDDDEEEEESPSRIVEIPEFYDYQALVNHRLDEGSLELSLFGARDSLAFDIGADDARSDPRVQGRLESTSSYRTLGLNWTQRWSPLLDQEMVLAYSRAEGYFQIGTDATGTPFFLRSRVDGIRWQPELRWNLREGHRWYTGIAVDYYDAPLEFYMTRFPTEDDVDFDFTTQPTYRFDKSVEILSYGPYVKQRIEWTDRTTTILGLRYSDISVSGGHHSRTLSPRGAVEYDLTEKTLLMASFGRYVQLPDVGSLLDGVGNPDLEITESLHGIVGFQYEFSPLYSLKTEVYYKDMSSLVVVDDSESPPDNYSNAGKGEAWGVELFFKRRAESRKMGWLTLSYSRSERTNTNTGVTRDFAGDQPFVLDAVWGQPFPGSWHRWLWSVRFQLHSGAPYTEITGRHREDPDDPDSRWLPEYGEQNASRTPLYYKVDLRISREFLFKLWKLKFYIDLQNATFHNNISGYDYGEEYEDIDDPTPVTGLGFFPFFGVETEF